MLYQPLPGSGSCPKTKRCCLTMKEEPSGAKFFSDVLHAVAHQLPDQPPQNWSTLLNK
jgi:hypothetical protein